MKATAARSRPFAAFVLAAAFLPGCSSAPKKAEGPRPLVAILPFANESLDVEAPQRIRLALAAAMKERGWPLVDISTIDLTLKGLGFSEGGQLKALPLDKLREAVPADQYCYGDLQEFVFKSAVALSQRKVALELRLVDAKTGNEVFKDAEYGVTSKAGADAAGDLVLNVVGKVGKSIKDSAKRVLPGDKLKKGADMTDEVADVELKQETREAIRKLLDKLEK